MDSRQDMIMWRDAALDLSFCSSGSLAQEH